MRADRTIGFIEPMARPRFRGGHDWRPSSGRRHGPLPDFSTRARGPSSSVLRATCARITVGTCSRRTREPITYHLVVATGGAPEDLVRSLKSWLTRRLVEAGALPPKTRLWSRHASTVYLWTVRSRDQAVHYLVHGQDVEPSAI